MDDRLDLKALFSLTYGLYIVTSHDGDRLNGHISNTVAQVTDEPPHLTMSICKESLTYEYIMKSSAFGVSVLEESTPFKLIGLFGFSSGRDVDKIAEVTFKIGITGCPLVTEHSLALIEAEVVDHTDLGKHEIFIGKITAAEVIKLGVPLTYRYYRGVLRGKTPKGSPSYMPEMLVQQKKAGDKEMQKYVCDVCGYVYDPVEGDPENGIASGTSFEDIPDDWVCPVCGVSKEQFSPEE